MHNVYCHLGFRSVVRENTHLRTINNDSENTCMHIHSRSHATPNALGRTDERDLEISQ